MTTKLVLCYRCKSVVPEMAVPLPDPDQPPTALPVSWPIPHVCPHGRPCHGPALSHIAYGKPGGPCIDCVSCLSKLEKEHPW